MAHFAEIGKDGLVLRVLVVPNERESDGEHFLSTELALGGVWVQTSYNSRGGKRYEPNSGEYLGDNHLRYNFAAVGFTYDAMRDAFIPPTPHPLAELDGTTCLWLLPPEAEIDLFIPADLTE